MLKSYSNHKLKPVAAVDILTKYKDAEVLTEFEIVDIFQENVRTCATSEALGLVMRLDALQPTKKENNKTHSVHTTTKQNVPAGVDDYSELTRTTGTLPGKYTIKLDPDAKGVVHPVRCQPATLIKKIIEKLHEMIKDGCITKVSQPTEWMSSNGSSSP